MIIFSRAWSSCLIYCTNVFSLMKFDLDEHSTYGKVLPQVNPPITDVPWVARYKTDTILQALMALRQLSQRFFSARFRHTHANPNCIPLDILL